MLFYSNQYAQENLQSVLLAASTQRHRRIRLTALLLTLRGDKAVCRINKKVIAHRLSTVKNSDLVCVLEHGKIVEQGSYGELQSRENSRFGQMLAVQAL